MIKLLPLAFLMVHGSHYYSARELQSRVDEIRSQSEDTTQLRYRIKRELSEDYHRHGFRDVMIEVDPRLNVQISEGRQYLINSFWVEGASMSQNEALTKRMRAIYEEALEPHGLKDPAFVFNGDYLIFDEKTLIKAKGELLDALQAEGFLDASVIGPQIQFQLVNQLVKVAFDVKLGHKTRIDKVVLEGAETLHDKLRTCMTLHPGDDFAFERIEPARTCIETMLANSGYPFAHVLSAVERSGSLATITFRIDTNTPITIGELVIRGAVHTNEATVRQRLPFQIGEPFSLQQVAQARQSLIDSDLFDQVELFLEDTQGDERVKALVVNLHERPKMTFELGVGASLEDGPRLSLLSSRRNLFGLGMLLRTRMQVNYPALFYRFPFLYTDDVARTLENRFENDSFFEQLLLYSEARLSLGLEYPEILVLPKHSDGFSNLTINRELKTSYSLNRLGLDLGLSLKPTSTLRLAPLVDLEYGRFFCPFGYRMGLGCGEGPSGAATRWIDSGETQQATFRMSATYDGRDSVTRPTSGYLVEGLFDFATGKADLGDQDAYRPIRYAKLQGNINSYWPLGFGSVAFLSLRLGQIFDLADQSYVPLFKRYYLGGTSTLRGFGEDQVLPADDKNWPAEEAQPQDPGLPALSLGGNFVAAMRGELRFRLSNDYDLALFADVGELLHETRHFAFSKLAIGAGIGLRYQTPVGPLMLDLGMRVRDGNRTYEAPLWKLFGLHFSIGH